MEKDNITVQMELTGSFHTAIEEDSIIEGLVSILEQLEDQTQRICTR